MGRKILIAATVASVIWAGFMCWVGGPIGFADANLHILNKLTYEERTQLIHLATAMAVVACVPLVIVSLAWVVRAVRSGS